MSNLLLRCCLRCTTSERQIIFIYVLQYSQNYLKHNLKEKLMVTWHIRHCLLYFLKFIPYILFDLVLCFHFCFICKWTYNSNSLIPVATHAFLTWPPCSCNLGRSEHMHDFLSHFIMFFSFVFWSGFLKKNAVKGVPLPSPQVVIDFVLYPVHLSHAVMMSTIQLLSY